SIASGLAYQTGAFDGTVDALAGMGMDFVAPVYPGDTIRLRLEVASKAPDPSPRNGLIVFQCQVFNQKDRLTVNGELKMLIQRRKRRAREAQDAP
ncbi:MAG: dehydratase, partial [Planctomycetota bacterium]|nr:dehydratase [Planctomycetota bacterium]